MKKLLLILLVFIWNCSGLHAQHEIRQQALNSFNTANYYSSIKSLLKLEESGLGDFETRILLAKSYYAQREFKSALLWLQKAREINSFSPKYNELYADLLKISGDYQSADSIYETLGESVEFKHSNQLQHISSSEFEVYEIPKFNTKGDEFAPTYYRDGIIYIGNSNKKKNNYPWNNRAWLRPFYLPYKPLGGEKGTPSVLKIPKTKKYHVGTISFTRGGSTAIFSKNQTEGKKRKNKTSALGLYISKRKRGKWGKPESLSLNNSGYSVSHPALSASKMEMFFVSDMPGGYGGTDIYFARYTNGKWSEPINLGPEVNTDKDEMFPFVHQDGTLYFASDGHPGYGGLDIFSTKYIGGTWSTPMNLGQNVNSSYDDFGLVLDRKKNSGYFSSNRLGGQGSDDIYRLKSLNESIKYRGVVIDSVTAHPLSNVIITTSYNNSVQSYFYTDERGEYEFFLNSELEEASVHFGLKGYFPVEESLSLDRDEVVINVKLQPVKLNSGFIIPNLYYDFDSTKLKELAKKELTKLAALLKENSDWIVEIGSHTDSRASVTYNQKLSEERAKSVVTFLVQNGIKASRLVAKGYGESQLLNHCTDGIKCDETEHAINRRTEIKLIGFDRFDETVADKQSITEEVSIPAVQDLVYRIQLGIYRDSTYAFDEKIYELGLIEVEQLKGERGFRFYLGSFNRGRSAREQLNKVQEIGPKDAFLVAFYQGTRISLKEAEYIENQREKE